MEKVRRQFLELTGFTSSGIAIPFDEIPADSYDLDQTILYTTKRSEIVLRCHLNLGKHQFKLPDDVISDTDQSTWSMAQEIKIKPANDCILHKIEIQTPGLLLARQIIRGIETSDWHPLGLPPEIKMRAHVEQNFSFPNGLIRH